MTTQQIRKESMNDRDTAPQDSPGNRRICFVVPTHPSFLMGGAQYQVSLLIDGMIGKGFRDLHYVARRCDPEFESTDYTIHRIRSIPIADRLGRFAGIPSLAAHLARIRPDFIYQRVASAYTGYCAWYAKRTGVKFIWHIALMSDCERSSGTETHWRRPYKWLERTMIDYGIKHADIIVAQSNEQSKALYENYGRYPEHVIRNFHELPTDPIAKAQDRKRVLWIANFKPSKRPEMFIDLARSSIDRVDTEFLMIGAPSEDSVYMGELLSRMKGLPNLRWLGQMSQEQVNFELSRSHILVNTSKEEGFANTFIQAWMRGTPVVTIDIDPDGMIRTHNAGDVASCPESLLQIVTRLIANDVLLEEMSRNAIHLGHEHFSLSQRDKLIALFLE